MVYDKVANGLNYCKSKLPFLDKKIKLRADKTYIIPTGFGFSFSLLAMVLLVLAINSGNNLIYFFAFFLISMALTGMLNTNQNIEAVQVLEVDRALIFAREKNQLPVRVRNKDKSREIWDINLQIAENKELEESVVEGLHSLQEHSVSVDWIPTSRGLQKVPRLKIQSRFPFGMLRAWKYFESERSVVVFPERKGQVEIPLQRGGTDQYEASAEADTKGYFRDFRTFQKTDSPSRIDWKRSLKHQKHLVKNYEAEGEKKVLVDWELVGSELSFEDHISQLALWIDETHRKREFYSLKIYKQQSDFGFSINHYYQCMEVLARLQPQDIV